MGQSDDIEDLLGKVWGGRYQIQEFIGRGGMGMVFKARHLQMDRVVALKVIHRKLCQDEKQVQRFEQEARTSSKLHHPNSIRVYDYGTSDDGRLFMAMEFLSGVTLGKLIQGEGPQHPERVIHIARQIIKSLSEAHQLGLVHRDLKPENIVICDIYGERDFVKVLDFGIAKAIGPSEEQMNLTQTGFICGTPRYLSPEQALGHEVDGRADLYSVGVLMYEMLTGRPPFIGENPISIVMKHVHDDPPPLTGMEKYGEVGARVTWLIDRLLDKNPARRPSPGERIVEFVDERIDESELMGRPVASSAARTDTGARTVGHPDRSETRDFAEEASETMPPVSSDAKTIPPAPATAGRGDEHTAVLDNTTQPPRPPPVPPSDETAMIQRPEAILEGETRPNHAAMIDDAANETRILNLEEAELPPMPRAEEDAPRIRRTPEEPASARQLVEQPATRDEPRPSRRRRPRDPVWAWASAGAAVAIFILSGIVYWWAPPLASPEEASQASAAISAEAAVEDPVSSPVLEEPAVAAPVQKDDPAPAAPTPKPSAPTVEPITSGEVVGKALAVLQRPDPLAAPVEPKPVEPKPVEPKPVEAKPVEPKPVEAKPVEAKPVEAKPVEAQPVTPEPVEAKAEPTATGGWPLSLIESVKAEVESQMKAAEKSSASKAPAAKPARRSNTQRKRRWRPATKKKSTPSFEAF